MSVSRQRYEEAIAYKENLYKIAKFPIYSKSRSVILVVLEVGCFSIFIVAVSFPFIVFTLGLPAFALSTTLIIAIAIVTVDWRYRNEILDPIKNRSKIKRLMLPYKIKDSEIDRLISIVKYLRENPHELRKLRKELDILNCELKNLDDSDDESDNTSEKPTPEKIDSLRRKRALYYFVTNKMKNKLSSMKDILNYLAKFDLDAPTQHELSQFLSEANRLTHDPEALEALREELKIAREQDWDSLSLAFASSSMEGVDSGGGGGDGGGYDSGGSYDGGGGSGDGGGGGGDGGGGS
jgi:hypothetical protein